MNAAQALLREVRRSAVWPLIRDDLQSAIDDELETASTPTPTTDPTDPEELAGQLAGHVDPAVMNDALDPEA